MLFASALCASKEDHDTLLLPIRLLQRQRLIDNMPRPLEHVHAASLLLLYVHYCKAELFTAIIDLELLLPTERTVATAVRRYNSVEAARIELLQSVQDELTLLESLNITDTSHALLRYFLLSRLSWTWTQTIEETSQESRINAEYVHIAEYMSMPSEEDLDGAAQGLCRLTGTYGLTAEDVVCLRTPGVAHPSARDLNEVAERCVMSDDYRNAAVWWEHAMVLLDKEEEPTEDREEIAEYLAYALFSIANTTAALNVVNEQLQMTPDNEHLLKRQAEYRRQLKRGTLQEPEADKMSDPFMFDHVCRHPVRRNLSGLACKLTTNGGQPWLLLQPLKMEVLNDEPRIVAFHDFLGLEECRALRHMARPYLQRASVLHGLKKTFSSNRIGKVAWFTDHGHPLVARIARRISLATGLSMDSSEQLQVVNYGVGGHNVLHFDFPDDATSDIEKAFGSRLATWLMYLSDVEAGGATVFTWLQIAVEPEEGKAVFWFNLVPDPNGVSEVGPWGEVRTGDNRMYHGACPVLQGSKWIATKWIRERGQGMVYYDRPN